MQATVSAYDASNRSGRVITDAGVDLGFDEAALAAGRLRLLRPGQRVWIQLADRDRVTRISIIGPESVPRDSHA